MTNTKYNITHYNTEINTASLNTEEMIFIGNFLC